MSQPGATPQPPSLPLRLLAALLRLATLLLAPLLFLVLAVWLGLLAPQTARPELLAAGVVIAVLGAGFAGFLGESWIEDVVKTAMAGVLMLVLRERPLPAAVAAGLTAGFATATLVKLVYIELGLQRRLDALPRRPRRRAPVQAEADSATGPAKRAPLDEDGAG